MRLGVDYDDAGQRAPRGVARTRLFGIRRGEMMWKQAAAGAVLFASPSACQRLRAVAFDDDGPGSTRSCPSLVNRFASGALAGSCLTLG